MKPIVAVLLAACLGACSSVPVQQAQTQSRAVCDYQYMARVDQAAQSLRTEVHWVNCPLLTAKS